MIEALSPFVDKAVSNLPSILVTLIVSTVTGYHLLRKINKHMNTAEDQRVASAKQDLIDIVEDRVINEVSLSSETMKNLIEATGRKHEVELSTKVSSISVLQDVQLRIEESSHLNTERKEDYSEEIEDVISEIEEEESEQPMFDIRPQLEELEQEVENEDAEKKLDELKEMLDSGRYYHTTDVEEEFTVTEALGGAIAMVLMFLLIYVITDTVISFLTSLVS